MKCYTVAEIDITDSSWTREYVEKVSSMVEAAGGRYLARTPRIEKLEGGGARPQLFLIIEWPSREVAYAFYQSEAYKPYLEKRLQGSKGHFYLIAGEDAPRVAARPRDRGD